MPLESTGQTLLLRMHLHWWAWRHLLRVPLQLALTWLWVALHVPWPLVHLDLLRVVCHLHRMTLWRRTATIYTRSGYRRRHRSVARWRLSARTGTVSLDRRMSVSLRALAGGWHALTGRRNLAQRRALAGGEASLGNKSGGRPGGWRGCGWIVGKALSTGMRLLYRLLLRDGARLAWSWRGDDAGVAEGDGCWACAGAWIGYRARGRRRRGVLLGSLDNFVAISQ
jgi:hypothetical protein